MNVIFSETLSAATAPLVLVSGIGILVLTINARYIQATSRTRELYDHSRAGNAPASINREIDLLVLRCRLLKYSFATLVLSTILSSCLVMVSLFDKLLALSVPMFEISLVGGSCLLILVSMILLFVDVLLSMQATMIHIGRTPPGREDS
ncbi:MAG: DUF2721 domain-containing protein [Thermodesulfobacteriota bacterium]